MSKITKRLFVRTTKIKMKNIGLIGINYKGLFENKMIIKEASQLLALVNGRHASIKRTKVARNKWTRWLCNVGIFKKRVYIINLIMKSSFIRLFLITLSLTSNS